MAKRVLLCDDEIHILRAAEFKLARAGFDVQIAGDGQEAWEAIQLQKPDVLITDCQMPRLDGFGLVQRVREDPNTRDLPVLMLTAKGYELSQEELAEKWNVAGLIPKPFSPRELLRLVEQILLGTPSVATEVATPRLTPDS
jgi:DNA-binding response OmpR family regulator